MNNISPEIEVKIRANCDVAVEFFTLNFIITIKHGTKIIPPPTPKLLETIPAINDKHTKTNSLRFLIDKCTELKLKGDSESYVEYILFLRRRYIAVPSRITAKRYLNCSIEKIFAKCTPMNVPGIDEIAKIIPTFFTTNPFLIN